MCFGYESLQNADLPSTSSGRGRGVVGGLKKKVYSFFQAFSWLGGCPWRLKPNRVAVIVIPGDY